MKSSSPSKQFPDIIILGIIILLGVYLWFDFFTNYSVVVKYSDLWLPPLVGLLGLLSYKLIITNTSKNRSRLFVKLAHIPAIAGGAFSLIAFIPPMLFPTLIYFENAFGETRIEQSISPNGLQIARVYHRQVGVVDSQDKYSVRVSPSWFPFIEKEIHVEFYDTWWPADGASLVSWVDDNSLVWVADDYRNIDTRISADPIVFSVPIWLADILLLFGLLSIFT